MAFDGVILTDDLQMRAITDRFGLETAIERALQAGVDLLLFANNNEHDFDNNIVDRVVSIVMRLIKDGILTEERIEKSFSRIRKLKSHIGFESNE